MHVVFVVVDIKAGRVDEADEALQSLVVPSTSASPGFVRGVWWSSSDDSTGHALVEFDSEANAQAMAGQVVAMTTPEAPVAVRSVEVAPVSAEASA